MQEILGKGGDTQFGGDGSQVRWGEIWNPVFKIETRIPNPETRNPGPDPEIRDPNPNQGGGLVLDVSAPCSNLTRLWHWNPNTEY